MSVLKYPTKYPVLHFGIRFPNLKYIVLYFLVFFFCEYNFLCTLDFYYASLFKIDHAAVFMRLISNFKK